MAGRGGSGVAAPLLALVGPTAAGKTEAGIAVAEHLDAEIVSVDSMLVYRGMDVGTAKPTAEQHDWLIGMLEGNDSPQSPQRGLGNRE